MNEDTQVKQKKKRLPRRDDVPFLVMLAPGVIITLLFAYLPMVGLVVAFKDYTPRDGIFGSPWATAGGFGNFVEIFQTPGLPLAIWNTFWWNFLSLLISFPAPIILALLLNELRCRTFKRTVQTISYLPYFLSWISVTGIVQSLLSQYGVINDIIRVFGGERIVFLGDGKYFLPVYLLITVWKGMGWNSIIYLSAISGISLELYEAAKMDGAGYFKQAIFITVPSILPTIMLMLILNVGQLFGSNFELIYGLQNVAWDTDVISTVVYKYGIREGEYGLSTALGLMQGVIALILTIGANKVSDKLSNVSMW